jgi:cytochrome c biogenesis factor
MDRQLAPLTGKGRVPVVAATAVVAVTWLLLARLAVAFWRSELDWAYVAEQSRIDAPWYYRIAGVWGGMEGSLLLFAGIVGLCGLLALRQARRGGWLVAATCGSLLAVTLAVASPFDRLDVPATGGFGLTPILEHPAMTVHPPVLYLGLGLTFTAFVLAVSRRSAWPAARPWLLASVGVLTLAMTLGALWSYAEQGWGGYWAWDPVENSSLLVWLAALVVVHAAPSTPGGRVFIALPWVLALFATAHNRSGTTPSVHAFAEQAAVGWWLLGIAAATTVAGCILLRRGWRRPRIRGGPGLAAVLLLGAAAVLVTAGLAVPLAVDLIAGRPSAVRGVFYSRTIGMLAVVAVPLMVLQPRRQRGWPGVAHGASLLLVAGIAASTFDRVETVPIAAGTTVEAAGLDVTNRGVEVVPGPRADADAVVARLDVGGHEMSPSLVAYRANGGRLAETALDPGVRFDTQVVLDDADNAGNVIVTVHRRPLVWLVWLGALGVTVAMLGAAAARRRRSPVAPRALPPVGETSSAGVRNGVS